MPRIPRPVAVEYPHHITQRGNYQQKVFEEEGDYLRYLEWLNDYSRKYSLKIWAYCLMANHVHFVAVPMELNSFAKTFNTLHMRYSQYFNKKKKLKGHLWQGRFFSCILDEKHVYASVRYVDSVGKPLTETNLYLYTGNNPINRIDPLGLYWEYSQSIHQLTYVDNQTGNRTTLGSNGIYSGNGSGLNNPAMQNVPYVGPIPQGIYDIGPAYNHPVLGPATLNLYPRPGTTTYSRDAFRIHGDNSRDNQSASKGCIVAPRNNRNQINSSGDNELRVVP